MPAVAKVKVLGKNSVGKSEASIGSLDKIVNKLPRTLGLEVEAEFKEISSGRWPSTNFTYRFERDGSVKPSGLELVINPLIGDRFVAAMFELGEKLYINECEVNETCGFHVHVGARDFNWWDLRRLMMLYSKFEDDIFTRILPSDRLKSRYCKPFDAEMYKAVNSLIDVKSTEEIKDIIFMALYHQPKAKEMIIQAGGWNKAFGTKLQREIKSAKANKYGRAESRGHITRYFGLNLHSWFHRGTLEFRMKEGTVDVEELVHWPLFCGWFIELAGKMTDREVGKDNSRNLLEFCQAHMPRFIAGWVGDKFERFKDNKPLVREVQPVVDNRDRLRAILRDAVPPLGGLHQRAVQFDPAPHFIQADDNLGRQEVVEAVPQVDAERQWQDFMNRQHAMAEEAQRRRQAVVEELRQAQNMARQRGER